MKVFGSLLTFVLISSLAAGLNAADQEKALPDYQYGGITYMSMQADDGSWMDTVWALEVEDVDSDLFDLVAKPTSKRISIKVLTEFKSSEWVAIWDRKLQALNINNGLAQSDFGKSFAMVTEYLPEVLNENDQFGIESDGTTGLTISFNGEKIAALESESAIGFWMSVWISASDAGIYADGIMLAQGNIDEYLIDLQEGTVPSLNPTLISAAF